MISQRRCSHPGSAHPFGICRTRAATKILPISRYIFVFLSIFSSISLISASPVPFDRSTYPSIDLRLLDWPLAQRASTDTDQFTPLDCYTELDRSFIAPGTVYRLNNTNQLHQRACMLRIPTGTRLTIHRMHTRSRKSYVTAMTGSSQLFMPVWTGHIHQDQRDLYGPWHVPCQQAYLMFSSKSAELEWVEFRMEAETEQDRRAANPADCEPPEGTGTALVNHAEMEYNNNGREQR